MTRRRLTPEEIELWNKVVGNTERLNADGTPAPARPKPSPKKAPQHRAVSSQPARVAPPRPNALRMDHKIHGRMKKGKLAPEGRLDLHGMTLDAAHGALVRFILSAQASGKRLVLVITGKGRPDTGFDSGRGILRRQVPHWLEIPPLAQAVLQVTPAHIRHGGDGALYVYLKRDRQSM